jgi:hypothetical protein
MIAFKTMLACSALGIALMAGGIAPALAQDAPAAPTATAGDTGIDFGDDTSQWANDGECDDPRFAGAAAATELLEADNGHDATDCRAAYEAGTVALKDDTSGAAPADTATATLPDFGDDTSEWANDGECDDPRFTGPGSATELLDVDMMHDATDCRTAFEDGKVTLADHSPTTPPAVVPGNAMDSRINFGDDSGEWANDGECDDPDFIGTGMTAKPSPESRMRDATDCKAAFDLGTVTLRTSGAAGVPAFDYGSDTSIYANDGECDDLRFTGPGTDKKLLPEDMMADASDCRSLEADGQVTIRTVYTPEYAAGAPYDSTGIAFGDDDSSYANDAQCDDPRFEGPGTASVLLDSDKDHDATDCRSGFEAGTVILRDTAS